MLILASASPRRKDLLSQAGFHFSVLPAEVEEWKPEPGNTLGIALRNAERKADAAAELHPEDTVIGADTVIEFEGETLGKPADLSHAEKILKRLSGKKHIVSTGVCILNRKKNIRVIFTDCTEVFFRPYGEDVIREYLSRVFVLDKAGAYAIQECGDMLAERIDGSFSNIIGLPVERVAETLRLIGE